MTMPSGELDQPGIPGVDPARFEEHFVERRGRRLALDISGSGEPGIVFAAGGNCTALDWHPVMARCRRGRLVAYDRAGLGRSDAPPSPATVTDALADLDAIVQWTSATPVIVVGHSLGGALARAYAEAFPHRVRALVLVDPRPERFEERLPELVARTRARSRPRAATDEMPLAQALDAHLIALAPVERAPLWLVTHDPDHTDLLPAEPETDEERVAVHTTWTECQDELVRRAERGRLVVASGAGHLLPLTAPDLVARVVDEAVTETDDGPLDE